MLSIVVPCYNEEARFRCFEEVEKLASNCLIQ